MRPVDHVIVHCSATPAGKHFTVADIDGWHRARGWRDPVSGVSIGYHWVVYLDGSKHKGRPESSIGAHVAGHNSRSIGVCYIGGVDRMGKPADTRTPAQKKALEELIADICRRHPIKNVSGHNQFAAKACPSFDASTCYDHLVQSDLARSDREKLIVADDNLVEPDEKDENGATKVADWQRQLVAYGYDVPVTGHHTGVSIDATRWFQKANGIRVDGVVGPQTERAMELALGIRAAPATDDVSAPEAAPPRPKPKPKDGSGAAGAATGAGGAGAVGVGAQTGNWPLVAVGVALIAIAVAFAIYRARSKRK